jgi:HD-GYP domain-containing protein (c-di-GMP phosphodiesterase class II)
MDPSKVDEMEVMRRQLLLFAQDLQKVSLSEKERRREAEGAYRELHTAYINMVRTLAVVCEMKDNYTRDHLDRTYQFAMALTRRVAPELAEDVSIGYGYLLHDIGKVGVPDHVLNKPGPLDEDEWRLMRLHPLNGWQLVQGIKFLGDATHIIRSHHERWDGKGYPERKAGEDIYLPARIFSIIDTFDAMTSNRPYRKALPISYAMEEIERACGTQFDPYLAQEFVAMCQELGLDERETTESLTIVR